MSDQDNPFDEPGSVDAPKWDDLNGRLLLITPLEVRKDVQTLAGTGDITVADIVILDGPEAGEVLKQAPVFPKVLQGQLRNNVGTNRPNLGRVTKDQARKKPGQSPPWVLASPTDADKQLALAYLRNPTAAQAAAQEPPF